MARDLDDIAAKLRPVLLAYLCRLVVRPAVAEELTQTAFLRLVEHADTLPDRAESLRAWLFRVATHLAIDANRRHATWRETTMDDLRAAAEGDAAFMRWSGSLAATAETRMVVREHLVTCLACTMRNLPQHKAAAFWLREVYDFTLAETAGILSATETQVKNWMQDARASLRMKYESSCALVTQLGACHQCAELADHFRAEGVDTLTAAADHIDARLAVARENRFRPTGAWHARLLRLLDDLI